MVFKIALLSSISYFHGQFLVSGYYKEVEELAKVLFKNPMWIFQHTTCHVIAA